MLFKYTQEENSLRNGLAAVGLQRFWQYVSRKGSCWIWTGHVDAHGYSRIVVAGKCMSAHRLIYGAKHGPIAVGLVIDHLCRVTNCVNPDHLEAVSHSENVRRGSNVHRHLPTSKPWAEPPDPIFRAIGDRYQFGTVEKRKAFWYVRFRMSDNSRPRFRLGIFPDKESASRAADQLREKVNSAEGLELSSKRKSNKVI
jgi:hypothetical protein